MFKKDRSIRARVYDFYYDGTIILPNNVWATNVNVRLIGEDEKEVHGKRYTP